MLAGIAETQKFLNKTQKDKKRNAEYVLSNLRMSICEMG